MLTRDLGSALRALGQIPSDQEVEVIASRLEQDDIYDKGFTKVTFEDFCQVVSENCERKEDIRDMVMESFKTLDPKARGRVEASQLTSLLTSMGEALSQAEMKELLREAGVDRDGRVDYAKFVEQVLQTEPGGAEGRSGTAEQQEEQRPKPEPPRRKKK